MKYFPTCVLLFVAALPAGAAENLAELTLQVRATEIAFAKTLADRDVKTFTRMIAPDIPGGEWRIIFDRGSPFCDCAH